MSDGIVGRIRGFVHERIEYLRDGRRTTRQRLEDVFDRQTFTSIAVVGAMGKLLETSVVPFLDATSGVPTGRFGAWVIVFAVSLVLSIYWEHVAETAETVGDAAEEATDPEGE